MSKAAAVLSARRHAARANKSRIRRVKDGSDAGLLPWGSNNTNTSYENEPHEILATSETRLQIEQSKPIRAIFWPNDKEIRRLTKMARYSLRSAIKTLPKLDSSFQVQESSDYPESMGLLETLRGRTIDMDITSCDWEGTLLELVKELRENADWMNGNDSAQCCRDFNVLLQTKQPLWIDLKKLKKLQTQIDELRSSFLSPQFCGYDPRESRYLEWKAKRAAVGLEVWEYSAEQSETDKFQLQLQNMFLEQQLEALPERTQTNRYLKEIFIFLQNQLFPDKVSSELPPNIQEICNESSQNLILQSDISLLLELKQSEFDLAALESKIFDYLSSKTVFLPGPMGESPVHLFMLLGLKEAGKRVIDRFYRTPELVSVAYEGDLEPWKRQARPSEVADATSEGQWEDGIYTGETCLHMAIVQEDEDLVEFLLDRRISLISKATGRFFQPRSIRLPIYKLNMWRLIKERWDILEDERKLRFGKLMSFVQMMNLRFGGGEDQNFTIWELSKAWLWNLISSDDPSVTVVCFINEESRCYYGEYPLSFAASVGSVKIANYLYTYRRQRLEDEGLWDEAERRELDRQLKLRSVWGGGDDGSGGAYPSNLSLFVNAMDSFGNTAMHLAVMHGRRDMVDWLMSKPEGRESLEIINFDGFTPLTLAARHGNVELFHHILYEYLSEVVWVFGKMKMRVTDLYQVDTFRLCRRWEEDEGRAGGIFGSLQLPRGGLRWPRDDGEWVEVLQSRPDQSSLICVISHH